MSKVDIKILNKSKARVEIDFDFDWDIVNDVKKISGRKFYDSKKVWRVNLNHRNLTDFLQFCQNHSVDIKSNGISDIIKRIKKKNEEKQDKYQRNRELATKKKPDLDKVYGLSRGLSLRPFQRIAVEYVEANKKVLIGDEMGTGKTVETIGSIHHLNAYPALIVVPASLKENWREECEKWLPSHRSVGVINASDHNPEFRRRVLIINYDILKKHKKRLSKIDFKCIVADESHYLKNKKAQRTKAFKYLAKNVEHRILLSGTPVINRPEELISQLQILGVFKKEFGGFWQFTKKYCDGHKTRFGYDTSGASNLEELHEKLISTCYIRRNKEQVLTELPDKERQILKFDIVNRKEYDKVEEDVVRYLRDKALEDEEFQEKISDYSEFLQEKMKEREAAKAISKALAAEHLVKLSELRKVTVKGKMSPIASWIDDFLESGEKLVLFVHHKAIANALEERYDCLKITGSVPSEKRQDIVRKFQNDPDEKLIVLNIAAGGVGLTLTAASHVAFVELPWTPGAVDQAEDRLHRMGQKNAVNVYYLLAKDTIDERVYDMINNKRKITAQVNAGKSIEDLDTIEEAEAKSSITKGVIEDLIKSKKNSKYKKDGYPER